jgi:hypothetical protein
LVVHCVLRQYSGASELFDLLASREADVREVIGGVRGLVSYTLVRAGDGGFSVTVCEDKAGTDESLRRARDWIMTNAAGLSGGTPSVSEGEVIASIAGAA